MGNQLRQAVASQEVPPCLRFGGCIHFKKCKEDHLACQQFVSYVNKSGTRGRPASKEPSRKYYERVFNEDEE